MMTILHLLGAVEDTGGILTVIRNLHTAGAGETVRHLVFVNEAYRETRKPALEQRFSRFLVAESPSHAKLTWGGLRALPELRRLLRTEQIDILHAHTRGALILAMGIAALLRRSVLFTNHNYARRPLIYRVGASRRRMWTSLLTPNMARHYGLSIESNPRVRVISECCSDRFFELPLVRRPIPSASQKIRMVGLGSIVSWKKWDVYLRATQLLDDRERQRLEFHHWGPAHNTPASVAYFRDLEQLQQDPTVGDCHFEGVSDAVEEELRTADWFLLPSTNEPCSVALIEALAMGLPAIVSRSGGNIDIIKEGVNGLLFEPEDPSSLAEVLRKVLSGDGPSIDPSAVRESVRHRSAGAVAKQYSALYHELAQSPRPVGSDPKSFAEG